MRDIIKTQRGDEVVSFTPSKLAEIMAFLKDLTEAQ